MAKRADSKRWCGHHRIALEGADFATPAGGQAFSSQMPLALRCVVRANFVLPLLVADDDAAWRSLCVAWCPPRADSPMGALGPVILCYAQAIKWPPAIRHFGSLLPPPQEADSISGAGLTQAFHETLHWCDGQKLKQMHRGLSTNTRSHATSGIVMAGRALGMLVEESEERPGRCSVRLGPAGTEYALKALDECGDCVAWTDSSIEVFRAASLKWPSQGGDLPSFAGPLLDAICKVHATPSAECGLRGGVQAAAKRAARIRRAARTGQTATGDFGDGYTVKALSRHFLLAADGAGLFHGADGRRSFDDITMQALSAWLPDEKKQLETLWARKAGWLRANLAIDPLVASCHLCFAQALPAEAQRAIAKAPYPVIMRPVHDWLAWRDAHPDAIDCFPPNFHNLGMGVAGLGDSTPEPRKKARGS